MGNPLSEKQCGRSGKFFVAAPTLSASTGAKRRVATPLFLLDAFRPFYLGGALVAAISVPLWLGVWRGLSWAPDMPGLFWHAHEMVFGFAGAIIIGFLFTAARNWTGLPLPAGVPLALLFGLWLAARLAMFFGYGVATAVVDSLLLFVVAVVLARRFVSARSWASISLVVGLLLLAGSNITFHLAMQGWASVSPLSAVESGLMWVVLIELIVGARIVPGFSSNSAPGARRWRSVWLERSTLTLATVAFAADSFGAPPLVAGSLAATAGAGLIVQVIGWNPLVARGNPMLWVLHASYSWIPFGLLLLGLSHFGVVSRSAAIHAFSVGSVGGLIIGMITRTALGHSGRMVRAGRVEVAAFLLIILAAILRVSAALIPAAYLWGMLAAGAAWTAGFLVYLLSYGPLLLGVPVASSRADSAPD